MIVVAGIDVSKATLDVSVSEGPVLSFENSTTGIRKELISDVVEIEKA